MIRTGLGLLVGVVAVAAVFSVVVLDEREQAFRTLLDQEDYEVLGVSLNRADLTDPGWYVRIPGLHQLYRYDRRLQRFDAEPQDLYTAEELLLEVDYFAMWKIEDPATFFRSNRTRDRALRRIDDVTYGKLREILAQNPLSSLLSDKREALLQEITESCDRDLRPHGIHIVDLRIRQTDFPAENLKRVFSRMRADQERVAKGHIAKGREQALGIRSQADRESRVIVADARRSSEEIRGEGDARAARIYAEAYRQDAGFYSFVRSLETYRQTLHEGTTLVVSPRAPFLRYLFPESEEGGSPTR
ncbi:MAG: protease modulator HflC [Myxococcota bacterium]